MSARSQKVKRKPLQLEFGDGSSNEAVDIHSKLKTQAEIDEFSMAEGLPELERIAQLLDSKNELQRSAGIASIARSVPEFGEVAFISLFKRFAKTVSKGDNDIQIAAAMAITKILPDIGDMEFIATSCIPLVEKMITNSSGAVHEWVDALIVASIAADQLSARATTASALAWSGSQQDKGLRVASCRILGGLGSGVLPILAEDLAKIMATIQIMCQDTDRDVRATITSQLPGVAGFVDGNRRETIVFKELIELSQDEEIIVKVAALTALVDIIPIAPIDKIIPHIIRLFKEGQTGSPDQSYADLKAESAHLLGCVLVRLFPGSNPPQPSSVIGGHITYLLEYCRLLTQDSSPSIRRHCAYNIPAIAQCCGRGQYSIYVQSFLANLVNDVDPTVRLCIAHGFHELPALIGRDRSLTLLRPSFLKLLSDPDLKVQSTIVAKIVEITSLFMKCDGTDGPPLIPISPRPQPLHRSSVQGPTTNPDQGAPSTIIDEQILRILIDYDVKLELRWRERELLFKKLGELCSILNADLLFQIWSDPLLSAMHYDGRPVQLAAAATLVQLMRHQTRWVTRIEICQRIINDFAQSGTGRDRLLFLDMCPMLGRHFSRKWYRDRILNMAIGLCDDDVAIVRARATLLLASHCRQLVEPGPEEEDGRCAVSSSTVMKLIDRLLLDPNRDVQEAAQRAKKDLSCPVKTDAEFEAQDAAKELSEETIFHDDCSNFSAEFFKVRRSSSLSNIAEPNAGSSSTKSPSPVPAKKKSTTNMAVKIRAKTKMRKPPPELPAIQVKVKPETASAPLADANCPAPALAAHKNGRVPTLPTRLIGAVSAAKPSRTSVTGLLMPIQPPPSVKKR